MDLKNKREKAFLPFKTQLFHIQVVRYTASANSQKQTVTDDNQPVALQAARYALATPFAVTDMSPGTQTPGNGIEDTDFENDSNKE